jgi:hypothetical protein
MQRVTVLSRILSSVRGESMGMVLSTKVALGLADCLSCAVLCHIPGGAVVLWA